MTEDNLMAQARRLDNLEAIRDSLVRVHTLLGAAADALWLTASDHDDEKRTITLGDFPEPLSDLNGARADLAELIDQAYGNAETMLAQARQAAREQVTNVKT
jgi:hypothetical protein